MKSKTGIRKLKADRVAEHLRNMLLPLPEGTRLPSVPHLMKKTGAGQIVLCRVLRGLQDDGLIRIDPYRGIFRTAASEQVREIRLLHWTLGELNNSDFVGILFQKLLEQARAANRLITVENAGVRPPGKLAQELADSRITNVIVYGAASPDFARELAGRMKVCLELLPKHEERIVTELRDSPDMTVRQMDYLLKRGYSRIGYLHFCGSDMYQYPVQVHRLMDYYRLMAENGLRVNPDWVFHCSEHYENLDSGMARMMASDPKPEVLIVPGAALKYLYPYCRKNKIRIGKALALFSQDEINDELSPQPTTITNNPSEIAKTFWQMFQAAERGKKVENAYTKLFICTGLTVPSLKTAVK
jgi:DNA-binding LacI/PurR family transcriptional regulator